MDRFKNIAKLCKIKISYCKGIALKEIQCVRQDPQDYLMRACFKNFKLAGQMFISPLHTTNASMAGDVRLIPSEGLRLHISEALSVLCRVLIHTTMSFREGLIITEAGCLTVDGVFFFVLMSMMVAALFMFWFSRMKRKQYSWFLNQLCRLQTKFAATKYKRNDRALRKDPRLIFFVLCLEMAKFGIPLFVIMVGPMNTDSPLLLPSFIFRETEPRSTFFLVVLLAAELLVFLIALTYFILGAILFLVPMLVETFCIRSLRIGAFHNLNWRKRRELYVQLELVTNTLSDETRGFAPLQYAYMAYVPAGGFLTAIKVTSVEPIYVILKICFILIATGLVVGNFYFLRMTETIEEESVSLLDELRVEAAGEFRKTRLGVLRTRRRLIRQAMGTFKFIENGTALVFVSAVLDNVVSGIFTVQSATSSYYLR